MGMTIRGVPGRSLREFTELCQFPNGAGRLVPMTVYPAIRPLFDAYDARDPLTGLLRFDRLGVLVPKKFGKTAIGGAAALHELVNGTEPDREVIMVASDLEQSRALGFNTAVRFAHRQPWINKHVRVTTNTIVYKEVIVDPVTGGRHVQEHIIRAVPGRDARSLHGVNPSLVIFDEYWTHSDYAVVEALAPSPARKVSRQLFLTYAGLRSQMREGNLLFASIQEWDSASRVGRSRFPQRWPITSRHAAPA